MAINVEIKAKLSDYESVAKKAEELAGSEGELIHQHDVFFLTPQGRLKLRRFSSGMGQLIYYEREDKEGPKPSSYQIVGTDDPDGLQKLLSSAYGVLGEVVKERYLYLLGRTRIHLDKVERLGHYLELEVVLPEGSSVEEGVAEAESIMKELGLSDDDLVKGAYLDLLTS